MNSVRKTNKNPFRTSIDSETADKWAQCLPTYNVDASTYSISWVHNEAVQPYYSPVPNGFLQVQLFEECNYSCKDCLQRHEAAKSNKLLDTKALRGRLLTSLKVIHLFEALDVFSGRQFTVSLIGGEITLLPLHLIKGLISYTKRFYSICNLQANTNFSATQEYLDSVAKTLSTLATPVRVHPSFHDSILATRSSKQNFFKKVLKFNVDSLNLGEVNITFTSATVKSTSQAKALEMLYNQQVRIGYNPLVKPDLGIKKYKYQLLNFGTVLPAGIAKNLSHAHTPNKFDYLCDAPLHSWAVSVFENSAAMHPMCMGLGVSESNFSHVNITINGCKDSLRVYLTSDFAKSIKEAAAKFMNLTYCKGVQVCCIANKFNGYSKQVSKNFITVERFLD